MSLAQRQEPAWCILGTAYPLTPLLELPQGWDPALTHLQGATGGFHLAYNLTGYDILSFKYF